MAVSIVKYPYLLAGIFSPKLIDKIVKGDHIFYLNSIFNQTKFDKRLERDSTVEESLSVTFRYLKKNYRNEYVFKTAIINEIIVKRHNFRNVAMLTEFPANNAKADIVILNGTSAVYEIKSDLDNLERLTSQVTAYSEIFEHVNVVSNERNIEKLQKFLPGFVGIHLLNDSFKIEEIKPPSSNLSILNPSLMFNSLRKPEYLRIIMDEYGYIPTVPNTQIFSECKKLFCELSLTKAHNYFLTVLKTRNFGVAQEKLIKKTRYDLRSLLFSTRLADIDCTKFHQNLKYKLKN